MAVLITAAVRAHIDISHAQHRATRLQTRDRAALVLLDRLERELLGTLLLVKPEAEDRLGHPYLFIAEDRVLGETDSDAIRFITLTPARAARATTATGLRMVSYTTEPRADDGIDLVRQEEPLPESLDRRLHTENGQVVMEQLAAFQLRFLDDESGEWRNRWDSTDIGRLDRLPTSVELSVRLLEKAEEEETLREGTLHTRVVRLPMRPFDPADRELEDAGDDDDDDSDDDDDDTDDDDDSDE